MRHSVLLLSCLFVACGAANNGSISSAKESATSAAAADARSAMLSPALTLADLPVRMHHAPIEGTFTQSIDHANASRSIGNFTQRYWYSTEFASGPNAPVIFSICGEAECDPWYVEATADVAKSLGAAVVTLEHRYYGPSQPFGDESKAHMKYLTIHNALEDLASFERWAQVNLPLTGKWIAVGGSYSGDLAAFYRLTHPELVVGAWASSAPVNIVLAFAGYDQNAAQTLGPTCTLLAQQALAAADVAYKDATQCAALATSMYDYPDMCAWDETDFLSELVTYTVDGAAQYGNEVALCDALMQNKTAPLQGFIDFLNPPLVPDAKTTTIGSSAKFGPSRGFPHINTHVDPSATDFAGNEWYYQVCTEVGFYQIANADRNVSVAPDTSDVAFWEAGCQSFTGGAPNVTMINRTYYQPLVAGKASNILFVTGSNDPWSNLSFTDPDSVPAGDTAFNVQGGSHCQDMENLTPYSILGVFKAHKLFHDLAVAWLAQ